MSAAVNDGERDFESMLRNQRMASSRCSNQLQAGPSPQEAPAVLDIEASGFGRGSDPIEVGFCSETVGRAGCCDGWVHEGSWLAVLHEEAHRVPALRRRASAPCCRRTRSIVGPPRSSGAPTSWP